jgi:hypothetical protein
VTIGVLEVQAAAAVAVIDDAALAPAGIGPVSQALVADAGERRVELLVADQERVVLGRDGPAVSAKSSETPLSAATTRKCPNRVAGGRPRIPLRNAADRCWSRHETMVWFSCTLTFQVFPAFRPSQTW